MIRGNGTITAKSLMNGLIWTSYNDYMDRYSTFNVNFFSTATTLAGTNGAYTGMSSDFTNTSTATNGNWANSSGPPALGPDLFSIQWIGYFLAPISGTYTWGSTSDDSGRLWIGTNAITGYTAGPGGNALLTTNNTSATNTIVLTAGVFYPVRIQYGDYNAGNNYSLYFILPGGSSTQIYNGAGYYFNDQNSSLVDNLSIMAIPSTIKFSQSNTSIINSLIPGKTPWGIYDATMWNSSTNILPEARGNGRNVTSTGTVTYGTGSGFGAAASVPFISGTTTTTMLWPSGSIPTNFTICSITRYTTDGTNNQRILTSNSGNVIHGHHLTKRGVAYYNGITKTDFVNTGTLNNWLVMCGNNGLSLANGILVDSVAKGIAPGGTGGGQLAINMYPGAVEPSDWTFTYTVIYDTVLTDAEMYTVSNTLLSYLASGTMGDQLLPATPQSFSSNTLTVSNALNTIQNGTYTASASSYSGAGTQAWRIFYGALSAWHCAYINNSVGSVYNRQPYNTSGVYQGGNTNGLVTWSTTVQGVASPIGGEWVQIQLPYKLQLTTYSLYPIQGAGNWASRYPTIYYIVGSNDGTTWYQVDYRTFSGPITPSNGPLTYTTSSNNNYYSYFRLITNKIGDADGVVHYGKWDLMGYASAI